MDNSYKFHPYASGRVVTIKNNGNARIVAGRGLIEVSEIRRNGDVISAGDYLKVGNIIHTESSFIHKARSYRVSTKNMRVNNSD